MECHNCGKEIQENEPYYCWTFSIERYNSNTIQVDKAETIKVHCMKCGPGKQAANAETMRAEMN